MPQATRSPALSMIRHSAHTFTGGPGDYDPLIESIGHARFVLIGEASHGTPSSTAIERRLRND